MIPRPNKRARAATHAEADPDDSGTTELEHNDPYFHIKSFNFKSFKHKGSQSVSQRNTKVKTTFG